MTDYSIILFFEKLTENSLFFNNDFFKQLLITFISAFLGFFCALWANRKIEYYRRRKDKPLFIAALLNTLKEYQSRLQNINDLVLESAQYIPYDKLDTYFLDSISLKKYDYIDSHELCKDIEKIRSLISNINYKFSLIFNSNIVRNINSRSMNFSESEVENEIMKSLIDLNDFLNKTINQIKKIK